MRRDEFPIVHMAIKDAVVKALKDVRAEIDAEYKRFRNKSDKWDERASGIGTALEIIDRKIAEVTKNEKV